MNTLYFFFYFLRLLIIFEFFQVCKVKLFFLFDFLRLFFSLIYSNYFIWKNEHSVVQSKETATNDSLIKNALCLTSINQGLKRLYSTAIVKPKVAKKRFKKSFFSFFLVKKSQKRWLFENKYKILFFFLGFIVYVFGLFSFKSLALIYLGIKNFPILVQEWSESFSTFFIKQIALFIHNITSELEEINENSPSSLEKEKIPSGIFSFNVTSFLRESFNLVRDFCNFALTTPPLSYAIATTFTFAGCVTFFKNFTAIWSFFSKLSALFTNVSWFFGNLPGSLVIVIKAGSAKLIALPSSLVTLIKIGGKKLITLPGSFLASFLAYWRNDSQNEQNNELSSEVVPVAYPIEYVLHPVQDNVVLEPFTLQVKWKSQEDAVDEDGIPRASLELPNLISFQLPNFLDFNCFVNLIVPFTGLPIDVDLCLQTKRLIKLACDINAGDLGIKAVCLLPLQEDYRKLSSSYLAEHCEELGLNLLDTQSPVDISREMREAERLEHLEQLRENSALAEEKRMQNDAELAMRNKNTARIRDAGISVAMSAVNDMYKRGELGEPLSFDALRLYLRANPFQGTHPLGVFDEEGDDLLDARANSSTSSLDRHLSQGEIQPSGDDD